MSLLLLFGNGGSAAPAPPNSVSDLAATAGDAHASLSWTAPADGGSEITDYIVQYREI